MHASKNFIVSFFLSLAFAADHVPVTIKDFDQSFDVNCGGTTVKGGDIYNAIAYGMSLNQNYQELTSSDGRKYPSFYNNREGFYWNSDQCRMAPYDALQHYPVFKDGFFEDGNDAAKYRAIYWYNYEEDGDGHPLGYYCGTVYHAGKDNSYSGCDVTTQPPKRSW